MTKHPKVLSKETLDLFRTLVPEANVTDKDSTAFLTVDDQLGAIRIKRAGSNANQIHVWRGEPLAVHVPATSGDDESDEDGQDDRWYVVPIAWLLTYARKNAKRAAQHASHAFDCMMIRTDELNEAHAVAIVDLKRACEQAIRESRSREMRFIVKAVMRLRNAVADILIDTLEEEFMQE